MIDTYVESASRPSGRFKRWNQGGDEWTLLAGVRVYGASRGHCAIQVRGAIQQSPAGQNAWPAYMHAQLNVEQAREIAGALEAWVAEQESYLDGAR